MVAGVLLLLVSVVSVSTNAQDFEAAAVLPPLLPIEEEIPLAESAGPPAVARSATVYVLRRGGYVVAREGTNGFACLVLRSQPGTQEPVCYDPEGVDTILPRALDTARLREQGRDPVAIQAIITKGFRSGKYRAPRRAGIAYMLSQGNRAFDGEKVIPVPPHIMIYAPHVTNADIGADRNNPWLPWVFKEGQPDAYIIVKIRDNGGQEEE